MAEKLHSPEASETSGPIAQEIGLVRRAMYAAVNGFNDAFEFTGKVTGYTLGRTARSVKESAWNLVKGAKGEKFEQAV